MKFFASSMNPPLLLSPTVLTRKAGSRRSLCMILVVEPSIFHCSRLTMVSSRSWQLLVTPTLVVRTSITASSITSSSSTRRRQELDVSTNLCAMSKLKHEVEKAKRTLSSQQSTRIEIESFKDGNDFSETLTRAKFEELNSVQRSANPASKRESIDVSLPIFEHHGWLYYSCSGYQCCAIFPISHRIHRRDPLMDHCHTSPCHNGA